MTREASTIVRKRTVEYWDAAGRADDADTRDAILAGHRGQAEFDLAGREDAERLLLPFVSAQSRVLDVGCGMGRLLNWVAPHCAEAVGIDISREMIRKARTYLRRHPNVSLKVLRRTLALPFQNGAFDFIYFYHVSEHLEREEAFRLLSEMKRCLRSRGCALVQFGLIDHPDNQAEFRRWSKTPDPEGVRSRFYTEEEIRILLDQLRLYPEMRIYVPGEFVVIVSKKKRTRLGQMPSPLLAQSKLNSR